MAEEVEVGTCWPGSLPTSTARVAHKFPGKDPPSMYLLAGCSGLVAGEGVECGQGKGKPCLAPAALRNEFPVTEVVQGLAARLSHTGSIVSLSWGERRRDVSSMQGRTAEGGSISGGQ